MDSNSLVKFWNDFDGPKGFHPKDNLSGIEYVDWQKHESDDCSTALHKNLVPIPFVGNLDAARIFILMLNPGYAPDVNYSEEANGSPLIQLQLQNLRNELDFNWCLDPRWKHIGGGIYWRRVFRKLTNEIKGKHGYPTLDLTYSKISKLVAFIQLVPYHSQSFKVTKEIQALASVNVCQDYVRNELLPSGRLIVVHRAKSIYGLPNLENVVQDGLPRSPYLNRSEPERIRCELLLNL